MGTLYCGDNLDILRRYIDDESVDLVYLDLPFNSAQSYNAFFQEKDGTSAAAQIRAFEDTWEWNVEAEKMYGELITQPGKVSEVIQAFMTFLGRNDMMAYLAMMAPRLVELRRVLKKTGSPYLHCDPTASHYLKLLVDAVFGPQKFRSEIVWKRTTAHSAAHRWNDVHDTVLFVTKTGEYVWNPVYLPHSEESTARYRVRKEGDAAWADDNLTGPGVRHGDPGATWRGYNPTAKGSHWKASLKTVEGIIGKAEASKLRTTQKLDLLDRHGFIHWPQGGGFPRFKPFLSQGVLAQDVVTDITHINSQAQERLGYPTQKLMALLERIIKASSSPGDVVLDPFCGCGTTIDAAEKLGRQWIGIDITYLVIALIKNRLANTYGDKIHLKTVGEPVSLADAQRLAADDKFQFQWWTLGLVGARPVEEKKGADKGIDGKILLRETPTDATTRQIILSVKGGGVSVKDVRDLRGTVEHKGALIGVLITLHEATKEMVKEAPAAGFYESQTWQKKYPKLQLRTVAELLEGKAIETPPTVAIDETFKERPRRRPPAISRNRSVSDRPRLGDVSPKSHVLTPRQMKYLGSGFWKGRTAVNLSDIRKSNGPLQWP